MKKINVDTIRKLREETGAPIIRVKKVLEELKGDEKKALKVLKQEGFEKAAKREGRITAQGKLFTYAHHTGKVVAIAELMCETDFVARNALFEELGKNLAMQVASMSPKNVAELNQQKFIKDEAKSIGDLVKEVIAKTGENVRIGRIFRVELGKK